MVGRDAIGRLAVEDGSETGSVGNQKKLRMEKRDKVGEGRERRTRQVGVFRDFRQKLRWRRNEIR